MRSVATRQISPDGKTVTSGTRAAGVITGKDEPRDKARSITLLPDGRFVVGWAGGFVSSPRGLQIRGGDALAQEAELVGPGHTFVLHASGTRGIASGPTVSGYEASAKLVDLAPFAVTRTLPVHEPFAWLPAGEAFVAQTAHEYEGRADVDPGLVAAEKWLEPLIGGVTRLILVEPARERASLIRTFEKYGDATELTVSRDGTLVFWADHYGRVAAEEIAAAKTRWSLRLKLPGNVPDNFSAFSLALSPGGQTLAVGGSAWSGARDLALIDAASGRILLEIPLLARLRGGSRIDALAWLDDDRLLAATAHGHLALVTRDGAIDSWRAAQKGIRSIALDRANSRVVICGAEKQLRVWPI